MHIQMHRMHGSEAESKSRCTPTSATTRSRRRARWRRTTIVASLALVAALLTPMSTLAAKEHTVGDGETLWSISSSFGVSITAIAAANSIVNVNFIYAGQQLMIPSTGAAAAPAGMAAPSAPASTYTVAPGDSLWGIAVARGVTVASLMAANPSITNEDRIYPGQTIAIPGGGPMQTASSPAGGASSGASSVDPSGGVSQAQVRQLLDQYAAAYGLDPLLVEALAWQESGWQQGVISASGAIGVMQILPSTAAWLSEQVVAAPLNVAASANDNVLAGTAFLNYLLTHYGTVPMALAAYYQGPGNLTRYGILPETQHYINTILAIRAYIAEYGVPPVGS